jgi:hypothetical protein
LSGEEGTPASLVARSDWLGRIGDQYMGLAGSDGKSDGRGRQLGWVGLDGMAPADQVAGPEPLVELGGRDRRVHDGHGHTRIGQFELPDLGDHVEGRFGGGVATEPGEDPQRW